MSFYSLIAQFYLALMNIPFSDCTSIYLFIHLLKDILDASNFGQLWIKLLETSMCRFCVEINFHFLWVNTRSVISRSYNENIFSFVENCLPKGLCHVAFPPAMNKCSYFSKSSRAFSIVSILNFHHVKRYIVVSSLF